MSNDHDDDRMITTINHDARRPTQHSGGHSRLSDILQTSAKVPNTDGSLPIGCISIWFWR